MLETEDQKKQALNEYLLKLKSQRDGARDTQEQTQVTQADVARNTQDKVTRAQMAGFQDAANSVGAIGGKVAQSNMGEFNKSLDAAGDEQIAGRNALNKQAIDAEARANKLSFDAQYDPMKLEQTQLQNENQRVDNQVNQGTADNRVASSAETLQTQKDINAETVRNQDPTSEYSKAMREIMRQAKFNVSDSASAAVLLKGAPFMKSALENETSARVERIKADNDAAKAARDAQNANFSRTQDLRKEYTSHPVTKETKDLESNYSRILKAEKTGAGDQALIFSYMKMLDPASTVREGEFATAQNSGGVPASVLNSYNKLLNGQMLTDEQRNNFRNQSKIYFDGQLERQKGVDSQFEAISGEGGVDFNQVRRLVGPQGSGVTGSSSSNNNTVNRRDSIPDAD